MQTSKRLSSALAALACVGALGACGTGTASTTASLTRDSFPVQVARATADAKSVHISGSVTAEGMSVDIKGDLAVNGTSLSDLVARLEVTSALPRASATVLLTDGKAYLKTSGLPVPTKSSKPWLEVDLSGEGSPIAAQYKAMMSQLDPALLVKAFRATTQVKRVGPAKVAGVSTTHYVVTVDTAKVIRLLGAKNMLGRHVQEAHKDLPKTFGYDVWLDGSSRPVRIKAAYSGVVVDLTFTSWGEQVSVQAPPADQVSKISL